MSNPDFKPFAEAIRKHFADMATDQLFVVDSDRDKIWETYLAAFPEGTNKIFRKRGEFDCSCCRSFIRSAGNVVSVQNGALVSIWDVAGQPEPYQTVANAMSKYVKSLPIKEPFLTPQKEHGTAFSREYVEGLVQQWNHFSVAIPPKYVNPSYVEKRGELRATHDVLVRGLTELSPESVSIVLDLIDGKSIYRGDEHRKAVADFKALQDRYLAAPDNARSLMGWSLLNSPVARFRNTVIGTLVQDLSDGVDLEKAVKSFETKVAPQNYKRPTALITKNMVADAMKTIGELGLESALQRRHAKLSDVSVNSVLFVDNSVKGIMKGGVESLLMEQVKPAPFDKKKATEIAIDEFVSKVLPKTTSLQVYLENHLAGNLVSLTAPVDPAPASLFKWTNDFAWSYNGNVADSIKDKVKKAGGMVENVSLRVSLAWYNYDDLDLHVIEPGGGLIYFGAKQSRVSDGNLDVDMNAGGPKSREPVENTRWKKRLRDGLYKVVVDQYCRRESIDVGFEIEIEYGGVLHNLKYEKGVSGKVPVADITVKNGVVSEIKTNLKGGSISQDLWGLKTQELVKVNSVVLSPNYWDENQVGNKHWFFILEGCKNPEPTRGIYNEFLNAKLEKHRKVFEILGDKTKCPVVEDQMSGIGVSSTRKDKVTVMAVGPSLNKPYTIAF
jgi:hypothetical protein